jgi:hypothetical protein
MKPIEIQKEIDAIHKLFEGFASEVKGRLDKLEQGQIVEMKDSIKLTKNSKGTNWEVRLIEKPGRDLLDEISKMETSLRKRYG